MKCPECRAHFAILCVSVWRCAVPSHAVPVLHCTMPCCAVLCCAQVCAMLVECLELRRKWLFKAVLQPEQRRVRSLIQQQWRRQQQQKQAKQLHLQSAAGLQDRDMHTPYVTWRHVYASRSTACHSATLHVLQVRYCKVAVVPRLLPQLSPLLPSVAYVASWCQLGVAIACHHHTPNSMSLRQQRHWRLTGTPSATGHCLPAATCMRWWMVWCGCGQMHRPGERICLCVGHIGLIAVEVSCDAPCGLPSR